MTIRLTSIQNRLLSLTGRRSIRSELSAEIGGCCVTQVVPIKETGIAKSGNISLTGMHNGKRVKIFTMFSEGQVKLRSAVDRLSDEILLPPLVAVEGRLVIEEWVAGVTGDKSSSATKDLMASAVRNFIASRQWRQAFPQDAIEIAEGFDYLDYLESRADQWNFLSDVRVFLEQWRRQRDAVQEMLVPELSHPDLTLQNLVISNEDQVYCIDNEFLHVGRGGFMDFYNSFLDKNENPFVVDSRMGTFYRNTTKLRHIGSALITGRPNDLDGGAFMFEGES